MIRHFSRHLIQNWLLLSIVFFFGAIFIYFGLTFNDQQMDKEVLVWMAQFRHAAFNGPAVDITALGSVAVLTLVTFAILMIFALMRSWQNFFHLLVAMVGAGLISKTSKAFYMRPRPTIVENLVEVANYSYPSGHSLSTATFVITIGIFLCEYFRSHVHRMVIFSLCALFIFLVGLSRMYLGVHYPSDVIGGIGVGVAWGLILPAFFSFRPRGKQSSAAHDRPPLHS